MSSIVALFPSQTLVDVLSLLLLNSEEEFYQRSIGEKTGHALLQVQHALERLDHAGLLVKRKSGNRVYYHIEKKHPAYSDLKSLFLKTVALGDVFRRKLETLKNKIHFAFIFGSIAKGEESAESDIDLFISGKVSLKELSGIMSSMSQEFGREINPIVYRLEELQEKAQAHDHFVLELLASQKIWLIGDPDEFQQMGE